MFRCDTYNIRSDCVRSQIIWCIPWFIYVLPNGLSTCTQYKNWSWKLNPLLMQICYRPYFRGVQERKSKIPYFSSLFCAPFPYIQHILSGEKLYAKVILIPFHVAHIVWWTIWGKSNCLACFQCLRLMQSKWGSPAGKFGSLKLLKILEKDIIMIKSKLNI